MKDIVATVFLMLHGTFVITWDILQGHKTTLILEEDTRHVYLGIVVCEDE